MDEIPDDWKESLDTHMYLEELIMKTVESVYEMGYKSWEISYEALTTEQLMDRLMQAIMTSTIPRHKNNETNP